MRRRFGAWGARVALTVALALVVVGADARHARFPVVIDPLAWFEAEEVVAPDASTNADFGSAVAVSGDVAVIGAGSATVGANAGQGVAYVFVQSGGTWKLQQELVAADGSANAAFGNRVAVSGTTAMVASAGFGSAVYVFTQSAAGVWSQTQKLTSGVTEDGFGGGLAVSGDTAIVGAPFSFVSTGAGPGNAYVFTSAAGHWSQTQEISAVGGTPGDNFGVAVAIDGDTAVIGAQNGGAIGQGLAYVFTRSAGTWTQAGKLAGGDSTRGGFFGASVALYGSVAVVGAHQQRVNGNVDQGAAYVFSSSSDGTWAQVQELAPAQAQPGLEFGSSVAMAQDLIVVGAFDTVGPNLEQGAAHVFVPSASGWTEEGRLVAVEGVANDKLGSSMAASGGTVLAGAPNVSRGANVDQGAAYFFTLLPADATSCALDAECGSGHCVDGVCCDRACSGQCEACDVADSVGTCSPIVAGPPHGVRAACDGAGTACAGACGPASTDACQYPIAGTSCGTTCEASELTTNSCDGAGTCVAGEPATCPGGFACAGTTCATGCRGDDECKADFVCTGGACVPRTGPRCVDGHTSQSTGGAVEDCGAYVCATKLGTCVQACSSVADCTAPNVCTPSGACVPPPTGASGGTACSAASARSSPIGPWPWLTTMLAALAAKRRRAAQKR